MFIDTYNIIVTDMSPIHGSQCKYIKINLWIKKKKLENFLETAYTSQEMTHCFC